MDGLQWKPLLKWMIWGYPYFGNAQIDMNLFYSKSNLYFNRLFLPVLVNNPFHATDNKKGRARSGLHSVVLPNSQPKQRIHVPCPDETTFVFRSVCSVRVSFRFGAAQIFMGCLYWVILSGQEINERLGSNSCFSDSTNEFNWVDVWKDNLQVCELAYFGPLIVMIRIFIQLSCRFWSWKISVK